MLRCPDSWRRKQGERVTRSAEEVIVVDAALAPLTKSFQEHRSCCTARTMGGALGVFRGSLAGKKYRRVFNTDPRKAILSDQPLDVGRGLQTFVEIQFADYIPAASNQLCAE
ncbi:MAG: hypothetical protein R3B47_13035 [Bacteroidia bacterium]